MGRFNDSVLATVMSASLCVAGCGPDPRGGPLRGNATMTVEGDARAYVTFASVSVTVGDFPARETSEHSPRVRLLLLGQREGDARGGGQQSLGGEFVIPDAEAVMLASSGWDFVLVPEDPLNPPGLVGQRLQARLDRMEMQAEPNGEFVATLFMREVETLTPRTVTVTGRLVGGCGSEIGGSADRLEDPEGNEMCQRVIGSLE